MSVTFGVSYTFKVAVFPASTFKEYIFVSTLYPAGATYGVFADKDCTKQLATLTTDENGNTDVAEVTAGTVYIKELSAPAGYKVDKTIYPLTIKAGETATLNVSDTPKVTDTLIELFSDCLCNPCTSSFGREIVFIVEASIILPRKFRTC